jgi:hypothetical protein
MWKDRVVDEERHRYCGSEIKKQGGKYRNEEAERERRTGIKRDRDTAAER